MSDTKAKTAEAEDFEVEKPKAVKKKEAKKKTETKDAASTPTKHNHPTYLNMIIEAIEALKDRSGSSRVAIDKYIKQKYNIGEKEHHYLLRAFQKGVENGSLKQIKGSFKKNTASLKHKTNGPVKAHETLKDETKSTKTAKPKTEKKSIAAQEASTHKKDSNKTASKSVASKPVASKHGEAKKGSSKTAGNPKMKKTKQHA